VAAGVTLSMALSDGAEDAAGLRGHTRGFRRVSSVYVLKWCILSTGVSAGAGAGT
jgi:hypothetical protein